MKVVRLFFRKAHTFIQLPLLIQLGFLPTWCLLGIARLFVLTVPFKKIAPKLGTHIGAEIILPSSTDSKTTQKIRNIGRLIAAAARYCPWNANCFAQAIVARVWLRMYKIPYTLYFGVYKDVTNPSKLLAHAWVVSGSVFVTGGNGFEKYTVVGTFVFPPNLGLKA